MHGYASIRTVCKEKRLGFDDFRLVIDSQQLATYVVLAAHCGYVLPLEKG
jgi:hypothetical protein